jgi:hypothetical protein
MLVLIDMNHIKIYFRNANQTLVLEMKVLKCETT